MSMEVSIGRQRVLRRAVIYPKRSPYAGYAAELFLPEKFRFCSILAQQFLKMACGSSLTRSRAEFGDPPSNHDVDFGPGMSERD